MPDKLTEISRDYLSVAESRCRHNMMMSIDICNCRRDTSLRTFPMIVGFGHCKNPPCIRGSSRGSVLQRNPSPCVSIRESCNCVTTQRPDMINSPARLVTVPNAINCFTYASPLSAELSSSSTLLLMPSLLLTLRQLLFVFVIPAYIF